MSARRKKPAKKATKKATRKKAPARKAARKSSAGKAAKKATKKKPAKKAAKKKPAKKVAKKKPAKKAAKKAAKKKPAKKAAKKKPAKKAAKKAAPKKAAPKKAAPKKAAPKKAAPKAAPKEAPKKGAFARKVAQTAAPMPAFKPKPPPPPKPEPPPPPPRRYKAVTAVVDGITLRSHPFAELSAGQLKRLYTMLVDKRRQIQVSRQQRLDEAITNVDPLADDIDIAQRHTEQASLMRFADKERKLLDEINHALEKLVELGEYGVCEGTEEPISIKRLEVRPWTRYSVAYKEQIERERKQHRR